MNLNTKRSFKLAVIGLVLLLFSIIITALNLNQGTLSIIVGILIISSFVIAVTGLISSLKSLKEPNTFQKIFGFIINLSITIVIILIIIANVIDISNALS
ncbi:hypothetical protein [Winogradskyella sp. SYSU M77433]|uniref:hypothetical protein n=1 Tax=Winogradskyella sp. SYSU M77433 TaxID=3042722 RepID=UPI00248042BA|nr:hypothetical protein [Winogradskyella sp. SYSU M77433]MDH7911900.1 hypothetical protein [Winogradskyella sp. SYSU M77433]